MRDTCPYKQYRELGGLVQTVLEGTAVHVVLLQKEILLVNS